MKSIKDSVDYTPYKDVFNIDILRNAVNDSAEEDDE